MAIGQGVGHAATLYKKRNFVLDILLGVEPFYIDYSIGCIQEYGNG